jgi:hypothetical protein
MLKIDIINHAGSRRSPTLRAYLRTANMEPASNLINNNLQSNHENLLIKKIKVQTIDLSIDFLPQIWYNYKISRKIK